ncbi:MAG: DUF1080 domain-containing protein [Verrucomicrobiales bacterium]
MENPFVTLVLVLFLAAASLCAGENPNTLTEAERQAGWRLLFDGKSIDGWRTYKEGGTIGEGWKVEDGLLKKQRDVKGGDVMTEETFEDFEFSWEWKLEEKGNNGVKYFIIPERGGAVGHEYQMIDDAIVNKPESSCASFYLVAAPDPDKPLKPMGEWNTSRIVVDGKQVEHWLNGAKVLEYECGDPAILEQVRKTKFKDAPKFGEKVTGHILLTDHKDECWFRNMKIRKLD